MAQQNLGLILMLEGNLAVAQQQIEQAIAIQRQAGLQGDLVNSLVSLGDLLLSRGDLVGSRKCYEESSKFRPSTMFRQESLRANRPMANAAGKASEGEALARQAAEIFRSKSSSTRKRMLDVLAKCLLAEGKISDAQAEANRSASLSPQDRTVRLSLAITAARVKARSGNTARCQEGPRRQHGRQRKDETCRNCI